MLTLLPRGVNFVFPSILNITIFLVKKNLLFIFFVMKQGITRWRIEFEILKDSQKHLLSMK